MIVLFVPKSLVNLLSISKIATQNQCHAIFYHFYYVFQDLQTKMMIGSGHEYDSLYYVDDGTLHSSLDLFLLMILHYNGIIGWDIFPYKSVTSSASYRDFNYYFRM